MEPSNSNGGREASASRTLTPKSLNLFSDGISLVLSRWTALQMAIAHQWGGSNSLQKSHDLASSILSWFSQSKEPLDCHDLEELLYEIMTLSFMTDPADGSVEEVAEKLIDMHEECLKGKYESIDKLRMSVPAMNAISHSKRVINDDNDDDDESSDEEASEMKADEPVMTVDRPKLKEMPEEGWSFVAPRRNRGKRSA